MQLKRKLILIALCAFHNVEVMASDVFINKMRASESIYVLDLVKLALSYSHRQYQYVQNDAALEGTISVFWGGTSSGQEDTYIPVHIDAYRSLMNLHFMIGRRDQVHRCKSINRLNQRQRFTLAQGRSWKDAKRLQAAGFDVVFSSKKTGLYHMPEGGRFNAFLRGATDAWLEANLANRMIFDLDNLFLPQQARESSKYDLSVGDFTQEARGNQVANTSLTQFTKTPNADTKLPKYRLSSAMKV